MDFRILGPFAVTADKNCLRLGGPKQRAVLALLVLRANQQVTANRLVEELWEGDPPESSLHTLRTYIYHLRRTLTGAAELLTRSPGYLLQVDPSAVDAWRFDRLARYGRQSLAAGRVAEAAERLREALEIWRGPALTGLPDLSVLRTERTHLEESRLAAVEARVEADLILGRHTELVGELEVLVAGHPLRENLHAKRMIALYRCGRQAEALGAYQDARRLLAEELGIEPGVTLRRLQQAILRQDPELDVAVEPPSPVPPIVLQAVRDVAAADPYVGRAAELARLRSSLADAREGKGALVLISGEPGIGKTRTAREIATAAQESGCAVMWGRSWEDGAPAFWPWFQALRDWAERIEPAELREICGGEAAVLAQLVPVVAERLAVQITNPPPELAEYRFRLFDAVTRALRRAAGRRPLLLVLDDIHLADVPSLRLLQFLTRELADAGLLILAGYRSTDRQDPAFGAALASLLREPVTYELRLHGLERAEVGRYVELTTGMTAAPSLVTDLHTRTGGNPFFCRELLRLLSEEGDLDGLDALGDRIPHGVFAAVEQRVSTLCEQGRATLTLAAVVGRVFNLELLAAAGRLDLDPLLDHMDHASAAGLVTEIPGFPGRYRFAHLLVRDALYATLSGVRRARLHLQVAEAIERLHDLDLDLRLAELAHHFRQAGGPEGMRKAIAYGVRAGEHAMARFAYEEAGRQFALALQQEDDPERRSALMLALGTAQTLSGDKVAGKETCLEAAVLARSLGLIHRFAEAAAVWYGDVMDFGLYDPKLVEILEAALEALGGDAPALRTKLLARLAMALWWAPTEGARPRLELEERCRALSDEAVRDARALDDPALLTYALFARHSTLADPALAQARLTLADEVVRLAGSMGDPVWEMQGRGWRVSALADLGEFAASDSEIDAYAELAGRLQLTRQQPWVPLWKGLRALMAGDLEAAEDLGLQALNITRDPDPSVLQAYGAQLWVIRREQGRLADLEPAIADMIKQFPDLVAWRAGHAATLAAAGRLDEARAQLHRLAPDGVVMIPRDRTWLITMAILADACVLLGDKRRAAAIYETLLPFEEYCATALAVASTGPVALHLGHLADLLGEPAKARAHYAAAARISWRLGAPLWLASARARQESGEVSRSLTAEAGSGR